MDITLTGITAMIGAGLGVWNFVQGFWQRRVRLKVVPKLSARRGSGILSSEREILPDGFMCIEVTNLSAFPVTIAEVGFSLVGDDERAIIIPDPTDSLPRRLEARESIDIRVTQGSTGFPKGATRGYATTQCNHTGYGDSIVLKKHRKLSLT